MLTDFSEVEKPHGDQLERTQFWLTPNGAELLDSCHWQVFIGDFFPAPSLQR
jgi:hypothetical protein